MVNVRLEEWYMEGWCNMVVWWTIKPIGDFIDLESAYDRSPWLRARASALDDTRVLQIIVLVSGRNETWAESLTLSVFWNQWFTAETVVAGIQVCTGIVLTPWWSDDSWSSGHTLPREINGSSFFGGHGNRTVGISYSPGSYAVWPLIWGWKPDDRLTEIHRKWKNDCLIREMNWGPQSDTMSSG